MMKLLTNPSTPRIRSGLGNLRNAQINKIPAACSNLRFMRRKLLRRYLLSCFANTFFSRSVVRALRLVRMFNSSFSTMENRPFSASCVT